MGKTTSFLLASDPSTVNNWPSPRLPSLESRNCQSNRAFVCNGFIPLQASSASTVSSSPPSLWITASIEPLNRLQRDGAAAAAACTLAALRRRGARWLVRDFSLPHQPPHPHLHPSALRRSCICTCHQTCCRTRRRYLSRRLPSSRAQSLLPLLPTCFAEDGCSAISSGAEPAGSCRSFQSGWWQFRCSLHRAGTSPATTLIHRPLRSKSYATAQWCVHLQHSSVAARRSGTGGSRGCPAGYWRLLTRHHRSRIGDRHWRMDR